MRALSKKNRDEVLAAPTGGFFTGCPSRSSGSAVTHWLDSALDVFSWRAVSRRNAAARELIDLIDRGDEDARIELLRLLAEGPPHVRLALVHALPDEIDYSIVAAAWRGAQQNLWRGSARLEKLLRRVAIALAGATCIGLVFLQNATFLDLDDVKSRSNAIATLVAITAACGVVPHLTAWVRFPARAGWRVAYYRRLSELIRLDATRERPQCLPLLPEVQAMTELVNGDVNALGRELRDTAAMIQAASDQRSRFPIPADSCRTDAAAFPIAATDSSSLPA